MIEGGCLCGAVRYSSPSAPLSTVICCCRDCQRASGADHLTIVRIAKEGFQVKGESKAFRMTGGSGKPIARHFCPHCGSMLFGRPEVAADFVMLFTGCIDKPFDIGPSAAIFTGNKNPWDCLPDGISAHEKQRSS